MYSAEIVGKYLKLGSPDSYVYLPLGIEYLAEYDCKEELAAHGEGQPAVKHFTHIVKFTDYDIFTTKAINGTLRNGDGEISVKIEMESAEQFTGIIEGKLVTTVIDYLDAIIILLDENDKTYSVI